MFEILKPIYIPSIPPTAVRKIEVNEIMLPPQNVGTYPPTKDPTTIHTQIMDFELFIFLFKSNER